MKRRPKEYHLDHTSVNEIKLYKKHTEGLLQFHWEYYSELAYQRNLIFHQLQQSLVKHCSGPFVFQDWQRAVKYKYCLEPLSLKGSLNDPGGRFNIGAIDTARFPPFPALYLASDKNTALHELLGQVSGKENSELTPFEIALTAPDSVTIVRVNGELEQVLDLTAEGILRDFLKLIKKFQLSRSLVQKAKQLKIPFELIRTEKKLLESLLTPNWRTFPMLYDVPANPQIFGQIAMSAGIEGILYPSKLSKQPCLAMFPQTFKGTSSFVELTGELPEQVSCRKLDGNA